MIETCLTQSTGDAGLDAALAALHAAVDAVVAADLAGLVRIDGPSTGLHAAARVIESAKRKLMAFDSAYVRAVETGDEPRRHACSSTAGFLREQLRLSVGEARRRVAVAQACSPRPGFSGEPLPPLLPTVAEAMREGLVSTEHAAVVAKVVDRLPAGVNHEQGVVVEAEMTAAALVCDPGGLMAFGRKVLDRADPDGALRDYEYATAHRSLTLKTKCTEAGGTLIGDLSVELLEKLQTVLESLARPVPADEAGTPDGRTPGQRLHDALLAVLDRVLAAGDLPACGGVPVTMVVHLTKEQFTSRRGLAVTDHGHLIPVTEAFRMADQAAIWTLVKDSKGVPLDLARTARIASLGQTIALAARDRGCSFPGCDRPPSWCQRHHVREWQDDGETNIDNLTLVCGFHHREFQRRGWSVAMVDGRPAWTPPRWIDPEQRPVRNHLHPPLPEAR